MLIEKKAPALCILILLLLDFSILYAKETALCPKNNRVVMQQSDEDLKIRYEGFVYYRIGARDDDINGQCILHVDNGYEIEKIEFEDFNRIDKDEYRHCDSFRSSIWVARNANNTDRITPPRKFPFADDVIEDFIRKRLDIEANYRDRERVKDEYVELYLRRLSATAEIHWNLDSTFRCYFRGIKLKCDTEGARLCKHLIVSLKRQRCTQETLHDAIACRDISSVKDHLNRGGDPNELDKQAQSPLHVAIRPLVNEGIVRELLMKGADPNYGAYIPDGTTSPPSPLTTTRCSS